MLSCKGYCQNVCLHGLCSRLTQNGGSLRPTVVLQVLTAEGALMTQPEYVLRFKPPLTIANLLPFDMTVIVTDRWAGSDVCKPSGVCLVHM